MKFHSTEYSTVKNTNTRLFLIPFSLLFLTIIPLFLLKNPPPPPLKPSSNVNISDLIISGEKLKECDIFTGQWVPYPKGPAYYTNASCNLMIDQQNCMKFGRPDTDFMKWRWRPDDCELPFFDARQFLELVRGKSMAFVGDSVGRNQMQSLLCLLAHVAHPKDVSNMYTTDTAYFKYWLYSAYNFTLSTLWSPFLVKSCDADPDGHSLNNLMNLYLDTPDESWANHIESFDYVIISAGQWFFRPMTFYMNGEIKGCHKCDNANITDVTNYYGYRMAFRTAFRTLQRLKGYKGVTFLRTYSPSHFENGAWNAGGNCARTRPFTSEEMKLEGYELELYLTQVEELRKAEKEGKKNGLIFRLLSTTEAMVLRPDGHPNYHGISPDRNKTVADCVHWCLPGPIDTWNEFLLYMMKREARRNV
ncbi:protein trichome birefringence-like 19 [Mercurialis annua]|uniref:protein trichome birefringence-like 19 n=1 Tax=Mercurialis annua TaxID=3986 RepID=UPI00215E9B63|nr:protein trichome birefringence-like 19 [Mercurialis annua]